MHSSGLTGEFPSNSRTSRAASATALTATQLWSYTTADARSFVLGDVQRLPNGNTLVIYSVAGIMQEVSPTGDLVQTLSAGSFGYANFRETMYGPPLR